ncbi:MAG: SDR family oxidoreductase [Rhodothermales bacterium]|nr:SDR family oxidoreductase [Rhodothermales bacterium]MBO6778030.1 SDR family oxidoreductase [Rhodothermales bacterium]
MKTALITGGSRGLGRHAALQFAEAGYQVAVCGRTEGDLDEVVRDIHDIGGVATRGVFDIRDRNAVHTFVAEVEHNLGAIDVLINNAGFSYYKPFVEWTGDELDDVLDVNLKGTVYACHAVAPLMIARKSGYIINIASDIGRRPIANMAAYVAAKHAVVGFTGSLYRELREHDVKVSVVLPGIIDTHFGGTSPGSRDHHWSMKPEDVATVLLQMVQQPGNLVLDEVQLHPLGQEI